MKKIYLLLVLLFTGLQSVFAQFIWHPDLGTPYAGAISLPWDTRSYMFQVDNGEEFGAQVIFGTRSMRSSGPPVLRGSV